MAAKIDEERRSSMVSLADEDKVKEVLVNTVLEWHVSIALDSFETASGGWPLPDHSRGVLCQPSTVLLRLRSDFSSIIQRHR
jgi:hypothetical protein